MIGAGELNEVWAFQQRREDPNGDNRGPFDPSTEVRLPAQVIWLKGSEAVLQDRLTGVQPIIIVVPDCEKARALSPAWRCYDKRRPPSDDDQDGYGNITGISPSKTAGYLDILASIGKAHG